MEINERKRDSKAQKAAGGNLRRDTDDGGHLIGARFGGLSLEGNLFPQDANLNRGEYKRLENAWAQLLKDGNEVYVDINVSSASKTREDAIYGSYTVIRSNGSKYTEPFSFTNENRDTQKSWEQNLD